ncbi:MAG: proteasome subunit alpha [Candidatus Nanopelagicales bacterium]
MSLPFYVSPEQIIKDKADYARKGIARGRSVVVVQYSGGILFVAENSSRALHKVSEIYDRIGFAAVGKYNEFENLRVAGVRLADTRGYAYARSDVTGRSLANAYAQTLGTIFTEATKPFEVELVVAEVGHAWAGDQIYRLTFDGSVADERGYVAMGGSSEAIAAHLAANWRAELDLGGALRLAYESLRRSPAPGGNGSGEPREIPVEHLEVAVLDRARPRRTFRRIAPAQLGALLVPEPLPESEPAPEPALQPEDREAE